MMRVGPESPGGVPMSLSTARIAIISVWIVALLLLVGFTVAGGTPITTSGVLLVTLAAVLPPVVLMMVFRGAPPRTVGQVIYDEEHRADLTERVRQIEHSRRTDV
jgi:hypothetical protein